MVKFSPKPVRGGENCAFPAQGGSRNAPIRPRKKTKNLLYFNILWPIPGATMLRRLQRLCVRPARCPD